MTDEPQAGVVTPEPTQADPARTAPAPQPAGELPEPPATPEAPETPDPSPDADPARKSGWQRGKEKADRLTADNAAMQLRLDQLERALAAERQSKAPPPPDQPGPEPVFGQDGLTDPDEFFKKLKDHQERSNAYAAHAAVEAYKADQVRQADEQARQRQQAAVAARAQAVAAATPDFHATVAPYLPHIDQSAVLSEYLASTAAEGETGVRVVYELCKRPDMLAAVLQAPAFQAGRMLLDIEGRLKSPPPKPATQAAPPLTPVGTAAVAAKAPEDMTPDEYVAWRKAAR